MKNLGLVLVVVFCLTSFMGCNKKKNASSELNAVTTENVISLDNASGNVMDNNAAVPVVEENATPATPATEGTSETTGADLSKPTPKMIQQALKNAGFYNGKIDGNLGPMSKKAISAFQSQNGLKSDGKVGKKTWKILASYLNKSPEVPNPSGEAQGASQ